MGGRAGVNNLLALVTLIRNGGQLGTGVHLCETLFHTRLWGRQGAIRAFTRRIISIGIHFAQK